MTDQKQQQQKEENLDIKIKNQTKFQDSLIHLGVILPVAYGMKQFYPQKKQFIHFLTYLVCCILAFLYSLKAIKVLRQYSLKANIFGKDINKKGTPSGELKIAEALGVAPAAIFLIVNSFLVIYYNSNSDQLVLQHVAGLFSICFIIFLGFCDDVFDLKWRDKLIYPAVATIPLLAAFRGVTYIVVPNMFNLREMIGQTLEIGSFYYIYMIALVIFCTNSINIYAGINGLEVSQSMIIACSILLHNFIEVTNPDEQVSSHHQFSIMLIMSYIFVTLALYHFNKYPSQVFVGDTFCYWSGMVFAVAGILGHFQKTLLLMFIPQVLNFVYSLPQLFKIIPCPRHRLPKYNTSTRKLEAVKSNLNLINLFLWIFGPMSEKQLCTLCVIFQILCSGLAFAIRYIGASYLY